MTKRLTDRVKALALATGLAVTPLDEAKSGVSYGAGVGIDFNGNVSVGGQILSKNEAGSFAGKLGANYILRGEDRGKLSLRGGVSYLFDKGFSLGAEGGYTLGSKNPFSLGIGGGYGAISEKTNNQTEEGGPICSYDFENDNWVNRGGVCETRCEDTGGTWKNGTCECPQGEGDWRDVAGYCVD